MYQRIGFAGMLPQMMSLRFIEYQLSIWSCILGIQPCRVCRGLCKNMSCIKQQGSRVKIADFYPFTRCEPRSIQVRLSVSATPPFCCNTAMPRMKAHLRGFYVILWGIARCCWYWGKRGGRRGLGLFKYELNESHLQQSSHHFFIRVTIFW